jgi:transmembrane sensor
VETTNDFAARWAVRADAGNLSPDEQRELDAWLAADPRHLGAYVRARAQWVDLDRLAAMRGPARSQESSPAGSPSEETDRDPAGGGRAGNTSKSAITTTPNLSRRQLLAAAFAGVGVFGCGLFWRTYKDPERYSSGIGEMRRIALADGSMLLLNTNSDVIVRLTKQQRDVQLVRGEAMFEVAHDKSRPFVVQANDARVRAVGTAFAVRLEDARIEVTVTEGVVEVIDLGFMSELDRVVPITSGANVRRVNADERAIIASAHPPKVERVAPGEADRKLAWREGLVSFEGETLQAAVSEINRHNRRQVVIGDAQVAAMPVVGVFRATDIEGFAAAAAAALNIRATADGDVIRLQSRSPRQ